MYLFGLVLLKKVEEVGSRSESEALGLLLADGVEAVLGTGHDELWPNYEAGPPILGGDDDCSDSAVGVLAGVLDFVSLEVVAPQVENLLGGDCSGDEVGEGDL